MGILFKGLTPSNLGYDEYLKILFLKNFGLLKKAEGEVLIVKLDNVKACNQECHSVYVSIPP